MTEPASEDQPYVRGVLQPGWRIDPSCEHDMAPCPFHPPLRVAEDRHQKYVAALEREARDLLTAVANEAIAQVDLEVVQQDVRADADTRWNAAQAFRQAEDVVRAEHQSMLAVHLEYLRAQRPTG